MIYVNRRSLSSHANTARLAANGIYNVIASMVTSHRIGDLTVGSQRKTQDLIRVI